VSKSFTIGQRILLSGIFFFNLASAQDVDLVAKTKDYFCQNVVTLPSKVVVIPLGKLIHSKKYSRMNDDEVISQLGRRKVMLEANLKNVAKIKNPVFEYFNLQELNALAASKVLIVKVAEKDITSGCLFLLNSRSGDFRGGVFSYPLFAKYAELNIIELSKLPDENSLSPVVEVCNSK
jgi:hypothetical protein